MNNLKKRKSLGKSRSFKKTKRKSLIENKSLKETKKIALKKDEVSFSHDNCFKKFFSRPGSARELFHIIFSKEELEAYDLSKIRMEKDNWPNKKTEKKADLVFSIPFKDSPEIKLDVFILLEHKSSYDKNLFEQLLDYQILIRKESLKQKGYANPIIPVLFYHGKGLLKWKKSLQEEDFKSSYERIPFKTRESMLNYRLRIVDTKDFKIHETYKERNFKGYAVIKLLSEIWDLKKEINERKLVDILMEFGPYVEPLAVTEREDVWQDIFDYISENTKLDLKMWEKAEDLLTRDKILKKGELMGLADTLRAEGMQKGIQQGMQKGRQEGRMEGLQEGRQEGIQKGWQKGRQEVILNMLKKKLDISFISEVTGLSEKEIKKLKNGS